MTDKRIETFLAALRGLQKVHPEFPLQYAICLAEIARREGMSLSDLSGRTGIPLSTVSRIIGALSRSRSCRGYGLVQVDISAQERRRKELYLTAQGRALIEGITSFF